MRLRLCGCSAILAEGFLKEFTASKMADTKLRPFVGQSSYICTLQMKQAHSKDFCGGLRTLCFDSPSRSVPKLVSFAPPIARNLPAQRKNTHWQLQLNFTCVCVCVCVCVQCTGSLPKTMDYSQGF